jgi:23S rRNA pseudouridine955/2504/2580 synthase
MNIQPIKFITIDDSSCGQRIDNFLFKILKNIPYNHIYKIINKGEVRVNKKRIDPSYKLQNDDLVRIPPLFSDQQNTINQTPKIREKVNIPILFEDDHYIIINKPNGIACHGGSGISHGIIEIMRHQNSYKFLELVHRLDKNTSGVLVLAKKRTALLALQESIKKKQVIKEYSLLSLGVIDKDNFIIQVPLYKHINKQNERFVKVDTKNGKDSRTEFKVIERFHDGFTLLNARLITGRTHQIRVHMQYIKHPILGDDKYGDFIVNNQVAKKYNFEQMFLHASTLSFKHYITEELITINADLPNSHQIFFKKIK